jgi:tetratricopeptide (TPR) repeat protein
MSDTVIKGVKRSPSRPASRHNSQNSSAKNRATAGRSAKPQPLKKRSAAEKAPARKATKTNPKSPANAATKNKPVKTKSTPVKKTAKAPAKVVKAAPKVVSSKNRKVEPRKAATTPVKTTNKRATVQAKPVKGQPKQAGKSTPSRKSPAAPTPPRQPTQDEAAALRAFERAHKEFVRGRFGEARQLFRALVEKHAGVSEVTARARTYLSVAESRLRAEPSLPRDADSLYDRGVIELNRGDYVAAQELFERALKREPSAAHIHYGLAATRSRLGSIDSALESLQRALEIQPTLRIRAQHDQDLTALRNDPEFERLVFAPRF